ncbi:MAG TPA: cation:proton antiporter [Patescibacteria group bacterium]|nr:cation:proton antiporter [Patescibacteria group bacterium]
MIILMGNIFLEITIIICLAAFLSLFFRLIKQPPILAYIATGIILGPFGGFQLQSRDFLQAMGELGIAFLLFMIGLELKFSDLKSVGKTSLFVGILQIVLTSAGGFVLSTALGFSQIVASYIGIALAFSSTIIVVKILSDKRDLQSLHGKLAIGILLVQDFFAIFILIFLSSFANGSISPFNILAVLAKGIILFSSIIFLSNKVFPKILDRIASSSETLFLFSIAWALGFCALVASPLIGFSIEIGGLLAGVALANTAENFQIIGKTKSLRDFFVVIFFVFLGMNMNFSSFSKILIPAIALSLFVLFAKPLIIMPIVGSFGYKKRTAFLTGISLSQVSEFSFIIIFLGNKIGQVPSDIVSLITTVGIVTFAVSTYMILKSKNIYQILGVKIPFFERKNVHGEVNDSTQKDHVVLVGANRTGGSVLEALLEQGEKVLVVDFNPDVIRQLRNKKIPSLFGDISDLEIQDRANIRQARLIISTVADIEDNLLLVSEIRKLKRRPKIVTIAMDSREEQTLKKAGVDYIIQPHILGGKYLAHLIKTNSIFKI